MTAEKSKTRKMLTLMGITLFLCALGAYLIWDSQKPHFRKLDIAKPTTREVTVVGEVVDAWCYASQTMGPGKGDSHKACALACINGGVSVGILEESTGNLFIAAKYKGYQGCRELLLPLVGEKVKATGWVGDLGGCRMLKIKTVEKLKSEKSEKSENSENTKTTGTATSQP